MGTPNFGEVDPSLFKYSTSRARSPPPPSSRSPLILLKLPTPSSCSNVDKFYLATVSSAMTQFLESSGRDWNGVVWEVAACFNLILLKVNI